MSKRCTRIVPLVLLFLLMLAACSPKPVTEENLETETVAIAVTDTQAVEQEPTQTSSVQEEPASEPEEVILPTTEPVQVDQECVDCHSDKERLIDTAKEEEVVEVENEGEG